MASTCGPALSADTAEEPSVAEQQANWALQITPYMWAAGISGDISPFRRAPTISIDKPFSDVLDDLNFGGFINIWGRYERFVFSGDIMYVDTTDSHEFGLPPLPFPLPPGTRVNVDVDTKQFTASAQVGYRLIDTGAFTLDALGGVRFWHISNDVTVSALGRSVSYGESFGWADPLVGTRVFLSLTDKLSLQAQADIGGFGAGSDLTWSVLGTLNYVVNENFSVSAGYKVLSVDYEDDGYVFDTRLSGPVLGITYRF
ncbi:MAG: hypothetical protein KF874_06825 [Rhizobiaceae bacterium]|nr:hypothetical protein [Rhizobiaceae bacterium]